ncbi:hypothetical protein L1049_003069 [Liquidambar formosana]|uniref:Uncharacterized protein n=1 Tax=Liquidambar formosana TaxID=63359 RepID=A0AAP0NIV9_LIQFO
MAESSLVLRRSKSKKILTDLDIVAAQQLMQLSGDDDSANGSGNKSKNVDEEIDQNHSEITSAKIREIFGQEEEVLRPRKRRYRSLVHIYMTTKPVINGRHGKKRRF